MPTVEVQTPETPRMATHTDDSLAVHQPMLPTVERPERDGVATFPIDDDTLRPTPHIVEVAEQASASEDPDVHIRSGTAAVSLISIFNLLSF